jgi:hypothetical protein
VLAVFLLIAASAAAHYLLRMDWSQLDSARSPRSRPTASPERSSGTGRAAKDEAKDSAVTNVQAEVKSGDLVNSDGSSTSFQTLRGRWLRNDGKEIDILKVADDGRLEANYYNPSPIHVSQATASVREKTLCVFVELQDVGYPGCTYRLEYDPQEDCLKGIYHQTAMQEKYEVVFSRAPAPGTGRP